MEWESLLAEFVPMIQALRQVRMEFVPPIAELTQHPVYKLMDQVLAGLNLVYSPGKVGSSTIVATLRNHPAIQSEVQHVHFLSARGVAFVQTLIERCSQRPFAADVWRQHVAHCHWLRVLIGVTQALRARGGTWGVVPKPTLIAGVREPIGMHLSFASEVYWMYADSPEGFTTEFVHDRLADDAWHRHCDNWFTNDLAPMFGIDVYARPFPIARGWDIYENEQARMLLIRQESLAQLPHALGQLYGIDPTTVAVETRNTGAEKPHAAQYARVRQTLRLSERELEECYGLRYVSHFYTPDEIAAFKARWRAAPARRAA